MSAQLSSDPGSVQDDFFAYTHLVRRGKKITYMKSKRARCQNHDLGNNLGRKWVRFNTIGARLGTQKVRLLFAVIYPGYGGCIATIYDPELTFMQDNAPIHLSSESRRWFENNGIILLDWPPYSPDPIENLWFPLKEGVYAMDRNIEQTPGGEDTVAEILYKAAEASWDQSHSELIKDCINCMKRRLAAVIEAEGLVYGLLVGN